MEFIIIGFIAVILIAIVCMYASRTTRFTARTYDIGWGYVPRKTQAGRLAEIQSLDLTLVRTKVAERHGWDTDRALAAEVEYRQFLKMLAENPGQVISPWSKDLDLFWHEHILDTKRYVDDCERLFGRMIHHDPHITSDPAKHAKAVERTNELRSRNGRTADAAKSGDSSSCSVMTAAMIACNSSHGHGSDGGHGGSHGGSHGGGHSCSSGGDAGSSHGGDAGGHSCGGHSCGSSCGGGGGCGGGGD